MDNGSRNDDINKEKTEFGKNAASIHDFEQEGQNIIPNFGKKANM